MKIAMLTPFFYPHTGGTEKYVKDLSLALIQAGHEVTVISNNLPRNKNAPAQEIMEGIKVIRLPAILLFSYLPVSWAFNLKMLEGYDIVHVHVPAVSFARAVAGKIKQPVVVTYHCDITLFEKYFGFPIPHGLTKMVEFFADLYARYIMSKVDAYYNTTETYAKTSPVMKHFPIRAIPIGIFHDKIDKMQKKLGLKLNKKKKTQILFLGRLAGNKGCHYLVQAMPEILEKFPETKLIICGEGQEKRHILGLIKKYGIQKSVEMYGIVDFAKLVELFYASLVYVFPSTDRLEAFGIVQLEAMSNYTAIVASDIPGPNAVMDIGKTGLLVPKKDFQAIADSVMALLADPERAIEMGKAGRRLVETKYDWKVIAKQVVNLYNEALAKKKGA
jgi:glycosyltransferase involved in cell wall biosynthesis